MMRFKKITSLILALALLVSMVPHVALEAGAVRPGELEPQIHSYQSEWIPNPLYPHASVPEVPELPAPVRPAGEEEFVSAEEATEYLRKQMSGWAEIIDINFYIDHSDPAFLGQDPAVVVIDAAFEHTGEPREGDYLLLHFGGCQYSWSYYTSGNRDYYMVTVYMSYYTTPQQEQELDEAVERVLEELKVEELDEYEKVRTIYDYIAENVRYDWEHLDDWDYDLQYTAYAALVQGTAVCQGYANLMYRMLLDCGVECRSVVSIPEECHAWNIVRVGGWYYNCDVTWDEGLDPSYYGYFLKGDSFYHDHTPEVDYRTEEFLKEHPMSPVDYDPDNPPPSTEPIPTEHEHVYYFLITPPTCTEAGYTTYACECGDTYTGDFVEPLGHDWDEGVVTREPTEDAVGVMTYTCLRCGETDFTHIPKLEHTHEYDQIVTAPTCTDKGYTTYICDCGEGYVDNFVDALGHDWDEGVVTREPTEDAVGVMTYTCLRCGETDTATIPKLEHTHEYAQIVTPPTCTEEGYTTFLCDCGEGYVDNFVDALGHDWDEGVVTREPTEDAVGVMTYTCLRCGETDTATIPKLEHTHEYTQIVTPPTCTEEGYTTFLCDCGYSYIDYYVGALGHDWDEGVVTREPTEDAVGVMTYTCLRCGETDFTHIPKLDHTHEYTETVTPPTCTDKGYTTYICDCGEGYVDNFVEALGHDWDEGVVTREPTEDAVGVMTYTCLRCGETDTSNIPKLEHTHEYTETVTPPTCTEEGYTTFLCDCGYSYIDYYVGALGHYWDEGVVTKEPTEDETGIRTYTCERCEATRTEELPKTEHSHLYSELIVSPTCTEQGYTVYTCDCGDSYIDDYTDPVGHLVLIWTTLYPGSCTEDEILTGLCMNCLEILTDVIPSPGHNYEIIEIPATCTEDGFTSYECTNCDESYTDHYVDALGHDWDEGVVTKEPTIQEPGERVYTCLRCKEVSVEELPKLEHTHSYSAAVIDPTCTEKGYTVYTCDCGDSYTGDYVDALGHDWGEWVIVSIRTCTSDGERYRVCNRCEQKEEERTPAWDHQYTEDVYAPSCTEQGYTIYTCQCGDSYIDNYTDPLGHDWDDGVITTLPSPTTPGVKTFTCRRCGETKIEQIESMDCPFTDVPADAYFYEPVLWAVANGITSGVSPTLFAPNNNCTRGQVVTFLWRAAGCPEPTESQNPFIDVIAGEYYYKAVLWAVEMGITQGVSADRFAPSQQVTRAQFVTFLWRAAGNPVVKDAQNPFTDVTEGAYYCNAVLWAAANGVTAGTSATTFSPDAGCTRGQVVTFLYRSSKIEDTPNSPDAGHEAYGAVLHELWQPAVEADLSTLPRFDEEATYDGIQQILDTCDPDGAFFFRWDPEEAFSWISVFDGMTSGTDTAIHETYHGFSYINGWDTTTYYLENGYYLAVPETETYNSEEMTVWIPEENRTFRFDPYVVPGSDLSSNLSGIYGLMNEFNAYQMGMNYGSSMFDYYCAQESSFDSWSEYIGSCENNRLAFVEFRYYILTYLLYAREYYPQIFAGLMDNEKLRYAFTVVESNFAADIAQYEADLALLGSGTIPGTDKINVTDEFVWFGGMGVGRFTEDCQRLTEAMEAPEYLEMMELFIIK